MIKAINRSIAARREDSEKGFTLIELLVVILIIGVLAAIAIPAFLNQRQGAWEAQVETDLKNAALAAEQYSVSHNGAFPPTTYATVSDSTGSSTLWKAEGFNATQDVTITYLATATSGPYTLTAKHAQMSTDTWVYSSDTGKIKKN